MTRFFRHDGQEPNDPPVSLLAMLKANEDDPEVLQWLLFARPGDDYCGGGLVVKCGPPWPPSPTPDPLEKKMPNDFTCYFIADSDGNALSNANGEVQLDTPDEAWELACFTIGSWPNFEVGQVCGVIKQGTTMRSDITVPLWRFYRNGPPGSREVMFENIMFPWITAAGVAK